MIKKAIVISLALSMPSIALADSMGFRVGAYSWSQNFSGDVRDDPTQTLDLEDTLGLDDDSNNVIYFALEHPIPIIPNILIQQTEMEVDGASTATFNFNDESFTGDIATQLDLSHTDATLYYEVLDNWVNLDIGLTVRKFDGDINITDSSGNNTSETFDEAIPMLYVAAKFDLPLTGLYVGVSGNGISTGDASLTDIQANLGYETSFGLGIEVGVRSFDLEYEDDDEEVNAKVDGNYISLFYHF
jgi:outer membrane protein